MMSDARLLMNLRRCCALAASAERTARACQAEGERFHHLTRADKHRQNAEMYRKQLADRVGSSQSYTILHKIQEETACVL